MTISKTTVLAAALATLGPTACIEDYDVEFDDDSTYQEPRYIPSYDNVCRPGDKTTYLAVGNTLSQVADEHQWHVATTMELCDENSCTPCGANQNPMLDVLRSAGAWGSLELNGALVLMGGDFTNGSNPSASPFEAYFAEALAYPWRQLLLGIPNGALGPTTLSLAHGIHRPCADGTFDCNDYDISIESLDQSCESLAVSTPVSYFPNLHALALGTSANSLGFEVPLTSDLPDTSSFQSISDLEVWLEDTLHVTVEMSDVEIDWSLVPGEGYCATVKGNVDADVFDPIAKNPNAVDAFADGQGRIPTVLSLRLDHANVTAG